MSVHSVQNSQQVVQAEAVSNAQSAKKQAAQVSTLPQDKVTISAATQGKQTAAAIGADVDHGGK
jgi:hypothetical protein